MTFRPNKLPPRARLLAATGIASILMGVSLPSLAQSYQLTALARATSIDSLNNQTDTQSLNLNLINQPSALSPQTLDAKAHQGGGEAIALFQGNIGQLKAYAQASHPYCCDNQGRTIAQGYSDATVQASFFDTLKVAGAGLADGTAVNYKITIQIEGELSSPAFEIGGFLSAYAQAETRLTDLTSGEQVILRWEAGKQDTGMFSTSIDTVVGHTLGLSASVAVGTYVSSFATTSRGATADFYHSFNYPLAPSIEGLNTVGLSGHDYMAPVPEPTSLALVCSGLGVISLARRNLLKRKVRSVNTQSRFRRNSAAWA